MTPRATARAASVLVALALLAGCGGGGDEDRGDGKPGAPPGAPASDGPPIASRPPARGDGSKDPDDLNGDGHRDLVVTAPKGVPGTQGALTRAVVVYGSAHGPDPATRSVYDRRDLGLPAAPPGPTADDGRSPDATTTADLDGDGFADVVSHSAEKVTGAPRPGQMGDRRPVAFVSWGTPGGPRHGARAVRLPATAGLASLVRGDFDGDGHHDLAGLAADGSSVRLLFGPFTRSGAAARAEGRQLPDPQQAGFGHLLADDIATTGRPRTTPLLVRHGDDGEQSGNLFFAARPGGGLAATGRPVREGNAVAFGDFDGDSTRDVAVGDDGSRNDEPGSETEPADVGGTYAVVPGDGGAPRTHRLPDRRTSTTSLRRFFAADPDGDGTDQLLVAPTAGGAVLLDGDRPAGRVSRTSPARVNGKAVPASRRAAGVRAVADFDGDGADEVVLAWSSTPVDRRYGQQPLWWWVTDGMSAKDLAAFASWGFVPVD
ncbi:FG-GAP repeat domain-containing protein [Streptomyces sp. G45]|uniref:FG-GAP repeat domain-containing protein n=1 Tax=Streptomyces sp. G45 TaxID=3406627 RepID=UPI003C226072